MSQQWETIGQQFSDLQFHLSRSSVAPQGAISFYTQIYSSTFKYDTFLRKHLKYFQKITAKTLSREVLEGATRSTDIQSSVVGQASTEKKAIQRVYGPRKSILQCLKFLYLFGQAQKKNQQSLTSCGFCLLFLPQIREILVGFMKTEEQCSFTYPLNSLCGG